MLRVLPFATSFALLLGLAASISLPAPVRAARDNGAQSAATASAIPTSLPTISSKPLQERSRLEILRSVDGEFARAVTSLPASKKGFHIKAGQALDQNALRKAIASTGAAFNPGDTVQITRLLFLPRGILFDLNGGGRIHKSFKDHLQLEVGLAVPVMTSSTVTSDDDLRAAAKKSGATLYLDFGRPLPDMNSTQLKQFLTVALDFTKQRSAAVQYVESLSPRFQRAIAEMRAEIGMDRDEVVAALGRPDHKVRDRDPDGKETEDWIYGKPPEPTTFVRFTGDTVTEIRQYPHSLPNTVEDVADGSAAQR